LSYVVLIGFLTENWEALKNHYLQAVQSPSDGESGGKAAMGFA